MATPTLKKTRIVCVSDTHNANPNDGAFKLPKGDVLIHAGDLTRQGSLIELRKTFDWLEEADFEVKLVVAGNHDITLDPEFYAENGRYFHNQHLQDPLACLDLLKQYPSITFLNHESTTVRLSKEGGPGTTFNVFGSPYSPRHGLWAFGYPPEDAMGLWEKVPLNTDILITHTPPKYHLDETGSRAAVGCESLRQMLWRIRPSLLICGHVHESRGAQRVLWDLDCPNVKYKETATGYWEDLGRDNKKQSLLDLTAKGRSVLQNSGPVDNSLQGLRQCNSTESPHAERDPYAIGEDADFSMVRGQGGLPTSRRSDKEALAGRMGRKETCIVNAAIMASAWPYQANKGRKYNKPIVVDIDLPVYVGAWQAT